MTHQKLKAKRQNQIKAHVAEIVSSCELVDGGGLLAALYGVLRPLSPDSTPRPNIAIRERPFPPPKTVVPFAVQDSVPEFGRGDAEL